MSKALVTAELWEKHFGNVASVPLNSKVEPFFNELSSLIEIRQCQEILDRQVAGFERPDDAQRMSLIKKAYFARNGKEMEIPSNSTENPG